MFINVLKLKEDMAMVWGLAIVIPNMEFNT